MVKNIQNWMMDGMWPSGITKNRYAKILSTGGKTAVNFNCPSV